MNLKHDFIGPLETEYANGLIERRSHHRAKCRRRRIGRRRRDEQQSDDEQQHDASVKILWSTQTLTRLRIRPRLTNSHQ